MGYKERGVKYDEAVKIWAAQKLSINPGEVTDVELDVLIFTTDRGSGGPVELSGLGMTEVLRELCAIADRA